MENPFQQLVPKENPPQQQIEDQVMGSVYFKSYMANIAEFFMAIFGLTLRDSLTMGQSSLDVEQTKSTKKSKNPHNPNKPDYFF